MRTLAGSFPDARTEIYVNLCASAAASTLGAGLAVSGGGHHTRGSNAIRLIFAWSRRWACQSDTTLNLYSVAFTCLDLNRGQALLDLGCGTGELFTPSAPGTPTKPLVCAALHTLPMHH
jgi:hypothetical protein